MVAVSISALKIGVRSTKSRTFLTFEPAFAHQGWKGAPLE